MVKRMMSHLSSASRLAEIGEGLDVEVPARPSAAMLADCAEDAWKSLKTLRLWTYLYKVRIRKNVPIVKLKITAGLVRNRAARWEAQ